jgi:flavin reductase (DIM6/NTAB) family NADH-FMN oxidoreductase RutF
MDDGPSDSLSDEGITEAAFKAACGRYATGVSVVTTVGTDGHKEGLTVNSFTSVSLDPPLVLFCLDKGAGSFKGFTHAGRFAVNVLREDQADLSTHFAKAGIPDKFAGIKHRTDPDGLPLLDQVLARIVCEIEHRYEGGDHVILVGRVARIDLGEESGKPLVYFRGGYGRFADGA